MGITEMIVHNQKKKNQTKQQQQKEKCVHVCIRIYGAGGQLVWGGACTCVCFSIHFRIRRNSGYDKCMAGCRHLQLSEEVCFRVNAHARKAARTPVMLTRFKMREGGGNMRGD